MWLSKGANGERGKPQVRYIYLTCGLPGTDHSGRRPPPGSPSPLSDENSGACCIRRHKLLFCRGLGVTSRGQSIGRIRYIYLMRPFRPRASSAGC